MVGTRSRPAMTEGLIAHTFCCGLGVFSLPQAFLLISSAWPSPRSGLACVGALCAPLGGVGPPLSALPRVGWGPPLPSPSSGSRARVQESTVGNHVGSRPFCAKAKFTVSCTTRCERVVRKTTGEQARLLRSPTDFETTLTIS